jgi:hypothetical protein
MALQLGSKLDCFATLAMTGPLDREWSEAMDGSATRFEAGLLRCARNDGAAAESWELRRKECQTGC